MNLSARKYVNPKNCNSYEEDYFRYFDHKHYVCVFLFFLQFIP
jgi:hypothetical protein